MFVFFLVISPFKFRGMLISSKTLPANNFPFYLFPAVIFAAVLEGSRISAIFEFLQRYSQRFIYQVVGFLSDFHSVHREMARGSKII